MENLQNVVIRKYKCDVCEYTSDRKRNVRRHWNKMHGDAKHQASPIVKAPMPLQQPVSCSDVETQTNPLQVGNPYLTRDVGTQFPD